MHNNWLQQLQVPDRDRPHGVSAPRRPVWTHSKKKRNRGKVTSHNEWWKVHFPKVCAEKPCPFDKDKETHRKELFRGAWAEWRGVRASPAAFKEWQAQARAAKNDMCCAKDPLDEFINGMLMGQEADVESMPWGIGDQEFPICASRVDEARTQHAAEKTRRSFIHHYSQEWHDLFCSLESGPGTIKARSISITPCCLEKCTECLQALPRHIQLSMQQVRQDLLMLVAPLRCKTLGKQIMLHFSLKHERSKCFTVLQHYTFESEACCNR